MSNHDAKVISPYSIERICKPSPEIAQLVLKTVDTTESVYTRILHKLDDATMRVDHNVVPRARFTAIRRMRPGRCTFWCQHGSGVNGGSTPVNLVGLAQPVQADTVQLLPHASALPLLQAPPTCNAAAAA